MKNQDEIATINKRHWKKMVKEECGFTRPWLELDHEIVSQYAMGKLNPVPETLVSIYPSSVLSDIENHTK